MTEGGVANEEYWKAVRHELGTQMTPAMLELNKHTHTLQDVDLDSHHHPSTLPQRGPASPPKALQHKDQVHDYQSARSPGKSHGHERAHSPGKVDAGQWSMLECLDKYSSAKEAEIFAKGQFGIRGVGDG